MANEELIELRNKLILGVSVALVITVPFLFFFITRYSNIKSKVYKAYRAEKTFVIYVTDSSCDKCSMVKNKLKNLDVEYIEGISGRNIFMMKIFRSHRFLFITVFSFYFIFS